MIDVRMPRLSDSMEEGTIVSWLKESGEHVEDGDGLVEIETDIATMTYQSPGAGVLHVVAAVGDTVAIGGLIARVDDREHSIAPTGPSSGGLPRSGEAGAAQLARPLARSTTNIPSTESPIVHPSASLQATPIARRLARRNRIDLDLVTGSGPHGRIVRADVLAVSQQLAADRRGSWDAEKCGVQAGRSHVVDPHEEARPQVTSGVRGEVLQQAAHRASIEPHSQLQIEVVMDEVIALCERLKSFSKHPPSLNDFIVKATALALRKFPLGSRSSGDQGFGPRDGVNVGIVAAIEGGGVIVPVARADELSLGAIAAEARRLIEGTHAGTIASQDLPLATVTVLNLGMFGIAAASPVPMPPQAAALGMGAVRAIAAPSGDRFVTRQVATLTASFDHRIPLGGQTSRFLDHIGELLQKPLLIAL